jgi:S1-C subfamily serine protease
MFKRSIVCGALAVTLACVAAFAAPGTVFDVSDLVAQLLRKEAYGSGFVIDADKGIIVTNRHVTDEARYLYVTLHDGTRVNAALMLDHQGTRWIAVPVPPAA